MTLFSHRGLLSYDAVRRLGVLLIALVLGDAVRSRRTIERTAAQREVERERRARDDSERRAGEERLRMARELHDVLAHAHVAINVQAGVALHVMDEHPEPAPGGAHRDRAPAAALAGGARGARRRAGEGASGAVPRPAELDRGRRPGRDVRSGGVRLDTAVDGAPAAAPAGEVAAYRIVQEALTNVSATRAPARRRPRRASALLTVEVDAHDGRRRRGADGRAAATGCRDARAAAALGGSVEAGRGPTAASGCGPLPFGVRPGRRPPRAAGRRTPGPDHPVLLADDQALVRAGFRALLDAEDDIEVGRRGGRRRRGGRWCAHSRPTSC